MQTNLTRRAALSGAVASVAMVGVAAAAAMPVASTSAVVSPALVALIAAHDAAAAAYREYGETVVEPLEEEAEARAAALPHTTITALLQEHSTANADSINLARVMTRKLSGAERRIYRDWRLLLAAHKRRERAKRQILRAPSIIEANQHQEALGSTWSDAMADVCHYPVSTAADLHAKLTFMVKHEYGHGFDWTEVLLADAARLAKMEG